VDVLNLQRAHDLEKCKNHENLAQGGHREKETV
jgi:hypothetical protein